MNFFKIILQKQNLISYSIIAFIFFFDRLSKNKIMKIQIDNNKLYINDFLNFDLIWNSGIGFGLLSQNSSLVYNSITALIVVIIFFLFYLIIKSELIEKMLFSLIVGGAIGNLFDRIVYFAVPDFIDIHYNNFHWFTFNIADIFITIGIIIFLIKDLIFKNEKTI